MSSVAYACAPLTCKETLLENGEENVLWAGDWYVSTGTRKCVHESSLLPRAYGLGPSQALLLIPAPLHRDANNLCLRPSPWSPCQYMPFSAIDCSWWYSPENHHPGVDWNNEVNTDFMAANEWEILALSSYLCVNLILLTELMPLRKWLVLLTLVVAVKNCGSMNT